MRIRIDIDITPNELTAWLESIAAPAPAKPLPTIGDMDEEGFDWDTDWDFPDDSDFDPEAESNAIAAAVQWAKNRTKGGDHA